MSDVLLGCVADIHSPRFLKLYVDALRNIEQKPSVLVLAGDNVNRNRVEAFRQVLEATRRYLGEVTIISIFGNEEYRGFEDKYRSLYTSVVWLDDEYRVFEIEGAKVAFIGTRGALDKPTSWQARNLPWIAEYYRELPKRIAGFAREARDKADYVVLVSHYGVTYRNLVGEPRGIWPHLASRGMEKIINRELFDLVIHGHAHNGRIERIDLNGVPVYNVSLPARKKIVLARLTRLTGLMRWLG